MSGVLDDMEALKRRYEKDTEDIQQAKGAEKQILHTLKEKYGIESSDDLDERIEKLDERVKERGQEYLRLLEQFRERYGEAFKNDAE